MHKMKKVLITSVLAVCCAAICGTAQADEVIRLLTIGNSYSESLRRQLPKVMESAGKKFEHTDMCHGGCTLQQHWENRENPRWYSNGTSLVNALKMKSWDIVTLQQASPLSDNPASFEPYFGRLVALIKELAPSAEIVVQQTWSWPKSGTKLDDFYDGLHSAYGLIAEKYGISRIIPVGYAVQLYRHFYNLDPLSGDKRHLSRPDGEYLQALVWAGKLWGVDPMTVPYAPSETSAKTVEQIRDTAARALSAKTWTDYGAKGFSATAAEGGVVGIETLGAGSISAGFHSAHVNASCEGRPLKIAGTSFAKGIGTHAPSSAIYTLSNAVSFSAKVGVDDESNHPAASVVFIVYADGEEVARSPVMKSGMPAHTIDVKLSGVRELELFVSDANDGGMCDHADWAEAKVVLGRGGEIRSKSIPENVEYGILTPPERPEPRINGARVHGARPGRPILLRAAVSGVRPMEMRVSKLPEGLSFDAQTGIFTGSIAEAGDYDVTLSVKNAVGSTSRKLTFRIGEKIALTPPMGWNSWNCFAGAVTGQNIRDTADIFISSGLADHGWQYVNIDDFWQNRPGEKRDATLIGPDRQTDGTIQPNKRFPDMKELADYIHLKGLKAGLYSSPGPYTCGGCVGSWKHEWQDARTYADWGFDYLKYDRCSYAGIAVGNGLGKLTNAYLLMGEALAMQKRDIVHSLCLYVDNQVPTWGPACGQCWRTTMDIVDTWGSMYGILTAQRDLWPFAAPGGWNDPDMLIVGTVGWGNSHPTRLTPNEQYTHVSLWSMLCAPLLIGCDLTKLDDFTRALLTNDEVIDINQDELGAQAALVQGNERAGEVWAKPMSDGSFVFALFNPLTNPRTIRANLTKLGLRGKWRVRDVWRQADEGIVETEISATLPRHATKLVRLYPIDGAKLDASLRDIRMNGVYNQFEQVRPLGK